MITLYGISNCDTVRKARKWLEQNHFAHDYHDFRKHGIDRALVTDMLQHFGHKVLINRRGTTWRQLAPDLRESSDDDALTDLLLEYPALIKRPVIQAGPQWLIGFNQQTQETLLQYKGNTQ